MYNFRKYPDLITCLLVIEQHNELLMKNHQSCSTSAKALPEANVVTFNDSSCGRRRGRGRAHSHRGDVYYSPNYKKTMRHYHNTTSGEIHGKRKGGLEDSCYRCDLKGH